MEMEAKHFYQSFPFIPSFLPALLTNFTTHTHNWQWIPMDFFFFLSFFAPSSSLLFPSSVCLETKQLCKVCSGEKKT